MSEDASLALILDKAVMRIAVIASVCIAGLALSAPVAHAAQADSWRLCEPGARASLNEQIKACTRVIAGTRQSRQRLAVAHYNRGWTFNLKGEHDRAINDFESAIRFEPDFANAFRAKGDAYRRKGLAKKAIGEFDRAIALKPDYAGALRDRGLAYLTLGKLRPAVRDLDRAVAILPDVGETYAARALAFERMGAHGAALADLDRALSIDGGWAEGFVLRANIHLKMKRPDAAQQDYKRALRLNANLTAAQKGLARTRKAVPALRPALALESDLRAHAPSSVGKR